jgi:hypothetical protein
LRRFSRSILDRRILHPECVEQLKENVAMMQGSKIAVLGSIIVVFVILQAVFIVADCRDTATGAAIQFSKAYFLRDPSMADRLCKDLAADPDRNWVKDLIQRTSDDAAQRGFHPEMLRYRLEHIHSQTIRQDDATAEIHLTAVQRVCINPVFAWVSKLFRLGETRPVAATLELVKEEGKWKVCGRPFQLVGNS